MDDALSAWVRAEWAAAAARCCCRMEPCAPPGVCCGDGTTGRRVDADDVCNFFFFVGEGVPAAGMEEAWNLWA
mgnify:CR=1 FL=1